MLICNSCGNLFERPKVIKDYHYELEDCPAEDIAVCPICEEYDIELIRKCKLCGTYEKLLKAGACPVCRLNITTRLSKLINNEFSSSERDVLDELCSINN